MLTSLVPVLFAFYLQSVLKFKYKISASKGYATLVLTCRLLPDGRLSQRKHYKSDWYVRGLASHTMPLICRQRNTVTVRASLAERSWNKQYELWNVWSHGHSLSIGTETQVEAK